ncbi:hypothetical protein BCR41DRAFT_396548, partial [Lobosporangium transversale]
MGDDSFNNKLNNDDNIGSDDDGLDRDYTGREHYVSVGKSQLRSKNFLMDDPKYKGKKASRKNVLELDSEEEENEEADELINEDEDENEEDDSGSESQSD